MDPAWDTLSELERLHGDAFYLLDLERFERNLEDFRAAFRGHYPRTSVGYSYKTNYTPDLCRRADELGAYAEVVSGMEYELARRLGVPGERIIFNGPLKTPADLERALLDAAIVNLDAEPELSALREIAAAHPDRELRVGLRCNFDTGAGPRSRFGFDVHDGQLQAAFDAVESIANARVAGLHCHYSRDRSAAHFAVRAKRMLALGTTLFRAAPPDYLDVGGGFCGRMPEELRRQFTTPLPTYGEYAEAVAPAFAAAYPGGDGPELILEPGIGVVGDVMRFVARVVSVKTVAGRSIAVTTGSIYNVKPTLNRLNLPLARVPGPDAAARAVAPPCDVTGYTCMEVDYMHRAFGEPVAVGDYLVFGNVGAYTNVLTPPFIRPAAAIVAAAGDGHEAAKRADGIEDVLAAYRMPPGGAS